MFFQSLPWLVIETCGPNLSFYRNIAILCDKMSRVNKVLKRRRIRLRKSIFLFFVFGFSTSTSTSTTSKTTMSKPALCKCAVAVALRCKHPTECPNFFNILQAAFACADTKSVIKADNLTVFLRFQDLEE